MKIGMMVNNLAVSGGYQKLVIRLAQALQAKGHEVIIYTPDLDKKKCYPAIITSVTIVSPSGLKKETSVEDKLAQICENLPLDLDALIIHDDYSIAALTHYQPQADCAVVWMLNNQLPAYVGRPAQNIIKTFITTTGSRHRVRQTVRAIIKANEVKKGLDRIQAFATYDNFNKELVTKQLRRKATNVYAGADLEDYFAIKNTKKSKSSKTHMILSVGVIYPHRRYEDLLNSIALLKEDDKNVNLLIVGRQDMSPEYYQQLQKLVKDKKIGKNVTFVNYATDDELKSLYESADIFAFVNDGFTWGISVFEAVAAGLPVVITKNIGAADIIQESSTGWVVDPKSPSEIAAKVAQIIDDPQQTKRTADNAYKKVASLLSWDSYADRMLELINDNKQS